MSEALCALALSVGLDWAVFMYIVVYSSSFVLKVYAENSARR